MKNFNIFGVHRVLEGCSRKTYIYIYIYIYIGGLPKKGRLGNFADLGGKGRLGKKEQGVFLRGEGAGWYPNPYYELH